MLVAPVVVAANPQVFTGAAGLLEQLILPSR